MMVLIRQDLAALGIRHDVFFSERSLSAGKVEAVIADLAARGLVYQGRLPPPKGQVDPDWEDREQTLFRSTAFGDDVDRPLRKSDGSLTYFASDIAYHATKFERGFSADDRRARRRSWRLCEAHAGGGARRQRRGRNARREALPAGAPVS